MSFEEDEENELKIRESFQLLTQGVEMVHYEVERNGMKRCQKLKKVLWLDPDLLRICISVQRPQKLTQKMIPGLYLRDIAETRLGSNAYDFINHSDPPDHDEYCLSLIGTESVLCLQLPTQFSRDWFHERFALLANDVWSESEKIYRAKLKWTSMSRRADIDRSSNISVEMRVFLQAGVKVNHHRHDKKIVQSILSFSEPLNRLIIEPANNSIFSFSPSSSWGLNISDIVEIRPGTHSYGFAICDSIGCLECGLSLIGTECTIDIQLASKRARDLLLHKLKLFIDSWATT